MATLIRVCRKCGAKIFSDAPEGLCTGCALESAIGRAPDAVVADAEWGPVEDPQADDAPAEPHVKTTPHLANVLGELGDYELLEEVGRGGQGVVFRARQKSLNRIVALKVIGLGQWATQAHLKRFRLEAEAAASLDHPCIVPIYEIGERDGQCYFTMKFVEGGQLDQVIKHTPLSLRKAAELISKLAHTVHYAHERGILHRDIKPGNILLDKKGGPHLTDFGLARLVESESTVTRAVEVLGTPSYMAPEQATGNNTKSSHKTHVYGLGAVLYQLLTGHPPFCRRNNLRDDQATFGNRTTAATPVEYKRRSRSFHDLPEVPRERSCASLLFCFSACRRLGTLAETRANPSQTHRSSWPWEEMAPTKSNYCHGSSIVARTGSGHQRDRLEKRAIPSPRNSRHRCAAI